MSLDRGAWRQRRFPGANLEVAWAGDVGLWCLTGSSGRKGLPAAEIGSLRSDALGGDEWGAGPGYRRRPSQLVRIVEVSFREVLRKAIQVREQR